MAMRTNDGRPNVVMIMADQWRGDCLGCAGHPVVQTPYLDTLASRGVRFTRAYTATPTCVPARAGLYTGQAHRTHGRVGYRDGIPWTYDTTIASTFTQAGYQTQAIGKMHVYPERHNVGFENVILQSAQGIRRRGMQEMGTPDEVDDYHVWLRRSSKRDSANAMEHGLDSNGDASRPWDKPDHLHYTQFVADESIDFLRRRDPTRPFFLFMSFNAPHPPFDPPRWAYDQYMQMDMHEPAIGDWVDMLAPCRRDDHFSPQVAQRSRAALRRTRAGYFGHITHIDAQIHRFMEMMRWRGLDQNTIYCFVSDHGEMLGDHHMFHKAVPYESSAHVPFILAGPNALELRAGSTCEAVFELRDVMPTLLEAAGVAIPETVEGQSALELARGGRLKPGDNWRGYLHGEHTTLGQSLHYVTDGREKYIWWSGNGAEQLFDLVNDPHECVDLARRSDAADKVAKWRRILMDELRGREEGFTDGEWLVPGRRVQPVLGHLRREIGWD